MAQQDAKITYSDGTTVIVKAGQQAPSNGKTVKSISAVSGSSSGSGGSGSSLIPGSSSNASLIPDTNYLNNQTKYLNNLALTGDYGQQSWAKQQLNEINYLSGLINSGDSGQKIWATQELGKYVNPTIGATSELQANTTAASKTTIDELKTLMQQLQQQNSLIPDYEPYEMKSFKFKAPNYSITADEGDTSFIPTLAAKNAWLQQEQAKADAAYKNYASRLSQWQNSQDALQNNISNLASLLPYEYLTAAQQAEADLQGAKALAEANSWENSPEYQELKKQELLANIAAKLHTANAPYSSGSGGNTKPTQNDYVSAFMQSASSYKSPANYKADLVRYKADIIGYIGASNWKVLYDDAEAQVKAGNKANANYVSGTSSPIASMLGK